MKSWLINFLGGYTPEEWDNQQSLLNNTWIANKKLMAINSELHNKLEVAKIQPKKKRKGRPKGSKNKV